MITDLWYGLLRIFLRHSFIPFMPNVTFKLLCSKRWMLPLFIKSLRGPLEDDDLHALPPEAEAEHLGSSFQK